MISEVKDFAGKTGSGSNEKQMEAVGILTEENCPKRKNDLKLYAALCFALGILPCCFLAGFAWGKSYFSFPVFIGSGICLAVLMDALLRIRGEMSRSRRIGRIMAAGIAVTAVAGAVTGAAIQYAKLSEMYEEAAALTDNASYQQARDLFEKITRMKEKYRDTEAYINLCTAHLAYDNDNIESAKLWSSRMNFSGLSQERQTAVDDFASTVSEEYEAYEEEMEELAKSHEEMAQNTYNIRNAAGEAVLPHRADKDKDPYSVDDYRDAEDFYYDNYDDFYEYEEAEDYYNEHHK